MVSDTNNFVFLLLSNTNNFFTIICNSIIYTNSPIKNYQLQVIIWFVSFTLYLHLLGYFMKMLFVTIQVSIYHHHHIALVARISLTLSRHSSLSFIALGRSSGQHPVSSHSCWMYVRAGRPAFARGSIRVHLLSVHLCFSSSVLHVWFV